MKKKIALSIWFVALFTISGALSAPLSFWRPVVGPLLKQSAFQISDLDGRLWNGHAKVALPQLRGPVDFQWRVFSLFEPLSVQWLHEQFRGWGRAQITTSGAAVWIDEASVESSLINPLIRAYKSQVTGKPLVVDRFYARWSFNSKLPDIWRGTAHWDSGEVAFPMGRRMEKANLNGLIAEFSTLGGIHHAKVNSAKGELLMSAKLENSGEAELSVMPAMVKAVGQPWSGPMEYPVLVMTERLF